MIDDIEDNIEATHHNVNAAANMLGQVSDATQLGMINFCL